MHSSNQYPSLELFQFCLASLGGIVDQYRHSAARARKATNANATNSTDFSQMIRDNMAEAATTASSSQNTSGKKDKNDKWDGDLRQSILVDCGAIGAHVTRFIYANEHDGNADAVPTCVRQIQSIHNSLIFEQKLQQQRDNGPTSSSGSNNDNKMELSTPSGLRNLGATCYLNSQLQCLAQNLGFIRGLFSWRANPSIDGDSTAVVSEMDKRMSKVLSNMQSILARMRYGPERVICTNDFAAALNLENDEMQDPNEVSSIGLRLFSFYHTSLFTRAKHSHRPKLLPKSLLSFPSLPAFYLTGC